MKKTWNKFTAWQMKWINRLYIEFELSELAMLWLCWVISSVVAAAIFLLIT